MRKKIMVICVGILLVLVIVLSVMSSSPRFHDTVYDYSDEAPRVGNNVYGYIDMPKGFAMTGSFNPADADYAGGADGIPEGVQLKNQDGSAYIIISLLTADKSRDDYIGLGDGMYQPHSKRLIAAKWDNIFDYVLEDLQQSEVTSLKNCVSLTIEGGFIEVNGMTGSTMQWKHERNGTDYNYRLHLIRNLEQVGVFHCVTVIYKDGHEECIDVVQTFSLTKGSPEAERFVGIEDRVGNDKTGYMNIPKGFQEYKGSALFTFADDLKKDAHYTYCASNVNEEDDTPVFEGTLCGTITKSERFDEDPKTFVENNFDEVFGNMYLLDYFDTSRFNWDNKNIEFGAEMFVQIMEQNLGEYGEFSSERAVLDGHSGYRIRWHGRDAVGKEDMYLSGYVLDSSTDQDVVYITFGKERTDAGWMWQYLESFRANDKEKQSYDKDMTK